MTATAVHEPSRPNREASYRPLDSDADWDQQVELTMAGESIGYSLEFSAARANRIDAWWRKATASTGERSRTAG